MTDAPILTTDRLILRPHRVEDYPACQALWADPDVVRFIGGAALDAQAVWFRILRYAGMWALLGYGMWAIEDRANGELLGEAGLLSAARGLAELDGVPEAGWVLGPAAWGRGIATEAMAAIFVWTDAHLAAPSIRCIIAPDNGGSIKVAEKLGFAALAEVDFHGAPTRVFDRPRQA
ncbi:Acetyltransferase, ribosomal protein N-acetylase [Sphingobium yanoikuyae]|uniref:Acetyltransferase, ribosomal protein N-acetylase n=1 Tax=Sphingobium yanoikuyae TaxID=13690 RepID=A0A084ERX4_SPHYA|nr:GNAT family N-acetyltransferase [Sphingobium yanoikuyae]KEZ20716.1 Acetyltransferase, ribosomal protein N-acetylase [Sphingobium yanoikuyae]